MPRRKLQIALACAVCGTTNAFLPSPPLQASGGLSTAAWNSRQAVRRAGSMMSAAASDDHDILLRVARGEKADRAPVWLMRQAGRYMADFRKYSDKYPFRMRSETPDIAIELSMQPWRSFGVDGVIMFSDILTPLPAMGVEFDVVKGKGPVIAKPIRTTADVAAVTPIGDIGARLPFVGETLRALRAETSGKSTLLGFVGAPWTLAAYAMEGGASKLCLNTKSMMMGEPALFRQLMDTLADNIGEYMCYQADNGAQMIQVFESWAHQLTPYQFEAFARPYADRAMATFKARHPDVPVVYFANGGSGYLEQQRGMAADVVALDQFCDMATARRRLGKDVLVSGNVDPLLLLGPEEGIGSAVRDCIAAAGGHGLVLNLGHGVLQQTPERAVAAFVETCKSVRLDGSDGSGAAAAGQQQSPVAAAAGAR